MGRLGFSVDRGGTFTDVCVFRADGSNRVLKLLSEDPANYADAPTEAIRRVLEQEGGLKLPRGTPIPTDDIAWIRMGTTVATNALLERKGERIALLITRGFRDLLFIGNQTRPDIFALDIRIPEVLYEVDERVVLWRKEDEDELQPEATIERATNGQKVIVERRVDRGKLEETLKGIRERGIHSVVVLLLHSHIYPEHELEVGLVSRAAGFVHVSLSHEIIPMVKAVPRGQTACVDGYLTPKIKEYIRGFSAAFAAPPPVHFMQSDGGLCDVSRFIGSRAILSGPAGGVVGVARTAYEAAGRAVIGFDMGGTSTDVCRFAGAFEHVMQTTTAGVVIQIPQLEIRTVAAGGGSRLFFEDGRFVVGPESAGAHPGPGGPLAITDANLVLGRIRNELFPAIFGPHADEALDKGGAMAEMQKLTEKINEYAAAHGRAEQRLSVEQVALGFVAVANEEMCRPIRALTQAKGFDTKAHTLACFGGAGGQHACAVARTLGIEEVLVHRYSGVLSAYGIALADQVAEAQEPLGETLDKAHEPEIGRRLLALEKRARGQLQTANGSSISALETEFFLHMRYAKTDCALMVRADWEEGLSLDVFSAEFTAIYRRLFGFTLPQRDILVDDVRVRALGKSSVVVRKEASASSDASCAPFAAVDCYFETGFLKTSLYRMSEVLAGHTIQGPAIIVDENSTILGEPACTATALSDGNIRIVIGRFEEETAAPAGVAPQQVDPIRLSIFANRFMSLAEQMGQVLQRTSISTNIKERLDFSCAIFGPTGGLVANAPHIPVHLGGMQYAVRFQIEHRGSGGIGKGDVILSNHPRAGGSHLPDFTVITPAFFGSNPHPVFFVANRGHHADIGGLVPGSLAPNAVSLDQEGAAFVSFKVVEGNVFQEEALIEQLEAPGKVPGCSATRNIPDVISDVKAQIAANAKGVQMVVELMEEYGEEVVLAYMKHIMDDKVGAAKQSASGSAVLEAEDFMDDGTPIRLRVDIDAAQGSAVFDFTESGPECLSCCNAPAAVTMSAVIYCLRCLVGRYIPLNEGCLAPVKIIIPDNSILSPSEVAAVAAGNVLTSQRLCDVIFKTFEAVAASQGCMNNIMFGDSSMGYYETVGGGAGAGDGFCGRDGVHTHMTNTLITDPEILESRWVQRANVTFEIVLREFGVRKGSGGAGRWRGGDGLVRRLQFRAPLSLSLLTERRALAPYGLHGGKPGCRGFNHLIHGGRVVNLGAKATVSVMPGIYCISSQRVAAVTGKLSSHFWSSTSFLLLPFLYCDVISPFTLCEVVTYNYRHLNTYLSSFTLTKRNQSAHYLELKAECSQQLPVLFEVSSAGTGGETQISSFIQRIYRQISSELMD